MKELMQGVRLWRNPGNGFAVLRVHYTADEGKRSEKWLKTSKTGTSVMDWNREMEINFEQSRAKRAFPAYDANIHYKNVQVNPYLVFHRCWDFGFRHPFCGISQINEDDIWVLHRELLGSDILLDDFIILAQKLLPKSIRTIDETGVVEDVDVVYKDYCDPAGTQKTDKNKRTSIEILHAHNIHPIFKKSNPEKRAEIIRQQMVIRPDGNPGMIVTPNCPISHAGFMGGYHFRENPTSGNEDEIDKEGYYEHSLDGWGYMAYSKFKPKNVDPTKRRRIQYVQTRFDRVTGL